MNSLGWGTIPAGIVLGIAGTETAIEQITDRQKQAASVNETGIFMDSFREPHCVETGQCIKGGSLVE